MNNITRIVIARHGTTEWNEKGFMQGIKDSPLTEKGIEDAKNLANELKDMKFDYIFSSDLLRAKRTAEIFALEKKLDIKTTELLREKTFGKYDGKPWQKYDKDVLTIFYKLSEQEKFTYKHADDMESNEEVSERFMKFVREIALLTPGKVILAISHGAFMRAVLIKLGFGTHENLRGSSIENGAFFILETDGIDFFIKKHTK